jgi:hypothetical protein
LRRPTSSKFLEAHGRPWLCTRLCTLHSTLPAGCLCENAATAVVVATYTTSSGSERVPAVNTARRASGRLSSPPRWMDYSIGGEAPRPPLPPVDAAAFVLPMDPPRSPPADATVSTTSAHLPGATPPRVPPAAVAARPSVRCLHRPPPPARGPSRRH